MNAAVSRLRWALGYLLPALRYLAAAAAIFVSLQWTDDAVCAVINASLFLLPFTLMLALSGRWRVSLSFAAAVALFLYGLGETKHFYFGNRLAVADWAFVADPANWAIVAHYPLLYLALGGYLALAAFLVFDAYMFERGHAGVPRHVRLTALVVLVALSASCWLGRHQHQWDVWQDEADCNDMHRCGVMGRLVYSISVFEYEPAAHQGDPSRFLISAQALPELPAPPVRNADIVVWLNESTFDPRNYQLPGARLPRLRMMDADATTRARGPLRVHTYGGKTWLSEFSLLTGLVPDDFGARRNLVFNTVSPRTTSNLVRVLKGNGYKAVVLMPTFKRFYGAGRTYQSLGFDQVLTLRDFPEYDALPGDEWDIADSARLAEAAQSIVQRHRAGPDGAQPLLLYLLSIKEHAPYPKDTPVQYALDKTGIKPTLAAKLTAYLGKMELLDAALYKLNSALFQPGGRPVVYAWFGDHQAFFEEDAPAFAYHLPEPKNITQFQLRTNFAAPEAEPEKLTDIAFLPSLLVDYAGVKPDAYFEAQSSMRRLCGRLMDECPDKALVESYKAYVFSPDLALFTP